jgi:uncharacterized protein with NRDE domain
VVVVTNLRGYGDADRSRPSRGQLVSSLLDGDSTYQDRQAIERADFNPFNLIEANTRRAHFFCQSPETIRTELAQGLYGLSNGVLDEPWPKTMRLKAHLLDWLMADRHSPEQLFDGLRDETVPDMGLRAAGPSDIPQEPRLSSIFIRNPVYGTRCSTVVAVDRDGRGSFSNDDIPQMARSRE